MPPGDPLGHFAAVHGTTPGALLRHNGQVEVLAGSPPVVPGTWAWPVDPDALRVPYTVRDGDSLDGIAAHFPGADLVEVNAGMPETVASGVTVTVGSDSVTTAAPPRSPTSARCSTRRSASPHSPPPSEGGPTCWRPGRCWSARPASSPAGRPTAG
ncbi:hypothetical protein ACFQ0M_40335 [Kitasatospora aburaviensis]